MRPDLHLVGAAKRGATALATVLSEHSDLFLPHAKAPAWWSVRAFNRGQAGVRLESQADRDARYADSGDARCVLDASNACLMARTAARRMVEHRPDARFHVSLRDPVEMASAFPAKTVFNALDAVEDFETTCNLLAERAAGRSIPERRRQPGKLPHRGVCAVGSQLARIVEVVPTGSPHVAFRRQVIAAPSETRAGVLVVLGLPHRALDATRKIASAHFQRFWRPARLYRQPPPALAPLIRGGTRLLAATGAGGGVKRLLARRAERAPMRPAFAAHRRAEVAGEVDKLEALSGRDLSAWKPGGAAR